MKLKQKYKLHKIYINIEDLYVINYAKLEHDWTHFIAKFFRIFFF